MKEDGTVARHSSKIKAIKASASDIRQSLRVQPAQLRTAQRAIRVLASSRRPYTVTKAPATKAVRAVASSTTHDTVVKAHTTKAKPARIGRSRSSNGIVRMAE